MGIFNRRNAILGSIAWAVGKRVLRRKARGAVPGTVAGSRRPNISAVASALAALGALVWFWRRHKSDEEDTAAE